MKSEEFAKPSVLMVYLDTLLDTRLACLSDLPEKDIESIVVESYHERLMDVFPKVSFKAFREIYDKRDKRILKNALVTPIAMFINQFCKSTIQQNHNSPFKLVPFVSVNIWPYDLDQEEREIIGQSVRAMTDGLADVNVVSISYEELTPAFVKRELSLMVMYDYYNWLEIHSLNENFKKVSCSDIGLMAPALFFKEGGNFQDFDNVMNSVQKMTAPFVGLCLRPIEDFSFMHMKWDKQT